MKRTCFFPSFLESFVGSRYDHLKVEGQNLPDSNPAKNKSSPQLKTTSWRVSESVDTAEELPDEEEDLDAEGEEEEEDFLGRNVGVSIWIWVKTKRWLFGMRRPPGYGTGFDPQSTWCGFKKIGPLGEPMFFIICPLGLFGCPTVEPVW